MNIMSMKEEWLDWFDPYKDLKPSDIAENIRLSQAIERQVGQPLPERSVRKLMPRYSKENLTIDFDWPEVDDNDYRRLEERRIHYPIREPKPEEYVKRKIAIGKMVKFADGFGGLDVSLDIEEYELAILVEEKIYPFSLLLYTPAGIFYSIAKPVGPEDHVAISSTGVSYDIWKPGEPYKDNGETGLVYVPLDLPSLKPLRFKFTQVEPSYIHEQIPSFME